MSDWKERTEAVLKEVREWVASNDMTIETTGYGKGTKYNLYRNGAVVVTESNPWKFRDAVYEATPYVMGHIDTELTEPRTTWIEKTAKKKSEIKAFIEQSYEALEPETEEEFLMAILDHPSCDWGLARSFFFQQSATKGVEPCNSQKSQTEKTSQSIEFTPGAPSAN